MRKYLGTGSALQRQLFCTHSAVFSDGSFVYIPEGVRCPMELSSYFRINALNTGRLTHADRGR